MQRGLGDGGCREEPSVEAMAVAEMIDVQGSEVFTLTGRVLFLLLTARSIEALKCEDLPLLELLDQRQAPGDLGEN